MTRTWKRTAWAAALVAGIHVAPGWATAAAWAAPAAAPVTTTVHGMPRITAFDVVAVGRVEPGAELSFTLWGSPGGQALLQIDGAQRALQMVETAPGRYEGTYTVGRSDRIVAQSRVTANLRQAQRVTTALLGEPLQQGWPSPLTAAAMPHIEHLRVEHEAGRRGQDRLRFQLSGTPGGQASVLLRTLPPRTLMLDEVRPGAYVGRYVLPRDARLDTQRPVLASLRVGDRNVQTSVAQAFDHVRWAHDPHWACGDCATVEAVNRIEVDGDGRVLGTVAGGVLGAVVGSQFGKGDGRTAAGVAGAVGGALLGREIERRSHRRTQYEVVLRTAQGERRSLTFEDPPSVQVGDAVRLVGDTLEPVRG